MGGLEAGEKPPRDMAQGTVAINQADKNKTWFNPMSDGTRRESMKGHPADKHLLL